MCRLAFIKHSRAIGKSAPQFFEFLEKRLGGHGNGVAGFVNGEPVLRKGLTYSTAEAATDGQEGKWDNGYFFHTRLASAGTTCDANNHPFLGKDEKTGEPFFFMHNRTWMDYRNFLQFMVLEGRISVERAATITDSETMMMLVERVGFGAVSLSPNGVWVMLNRAGVTFSAGGDLAAMTYYKNDGDSGQVVALASEFPIQFNRRFKDGSRFECRTIKQGSIGVLANDAAQIQFMSGGFEPKNPKKKKHKVEKVPVVPAAQLSVGGVALLCEDLFLSDPSPTKRECPAQCGYTLEHAPAWQMLAHINAAHIIQPKQMRDSNCPICMGELKFASSAEWEQHLAEHVLLRPYGSMPTKNKTVEEFFGEKKEA